MDWNERFSGEEFHFGEAPAAFVRDHLGGLGAGAHVLTIAEGEGRNAVWLARQGCRVTAIEPTGTGREKAMALAARHGVTMEWRQESLESYGWPSNGFHAPFAADPSSPRGCSREYTSARSAHHPSC